MNITFDPTFKLSDILTSLSFILAVLALIFSQRKERSAIQAERVGEARTLLSNSLVKLERWRDVSTQVFDDSQPLIIHTTEIWAKDGEAGAARDHMWKELNVLFSAADKEIADEQVKVAHIMLYPLSASLPEQYRRALSALDAINASARNDLVLRTQDVIMGFDGAPRPWHTAKMGNALRAVVEPVQDRFREDVERVIAPLREGILSALGRSEGDLWRHLRERSL